MTAKKLPVWHEGEKRIQATVGVTERMESIGKRVIRDYMPDQHREFFPQVPFVVTGTVDRAGDAWATLLVGKPGFLGATDARTLEILARPDRGDPAGDGMRAGQPIGLLGIELHTRRRNRLNGVLSAIADGFELTVDQSFGNCPQYIQLRDYSFAREPAKPFVGPIHETAELDDAARALIAASDTFFVASYADREDRRQVDVSHRGGKTGFVRIADDGTLTIPDFAGNLFFATLGNILLNGKAGLVFVDFEKGDVLQLTGDAEVILQSPEIAAFQGAERLWKLRARRIVRRPGALAIRWAFEKNGWSPNSLMTGDWAQAADRLRAAELATAWRPFKVTKIVDESPSIRSFHLLPDDGAGLLPHQAGQHLPIRLTVGGQALIRTYTLSVAPSDGIYRISVKRGGVVSEHLHDHVAIGDVIEARAPTGGFVIDAKEKRPAVLLAGGVGITPLLAMLRHVVYEGLRTRGIRPTVLFHAVHTKEERAFTAELDDLVAQAEGAVQVVRVLGDPTGAVPGVDYDAAGRIDPKLLAHVLPFGAYDFYICGPTAFTQALYDALREQDVADDRIHAEGFGPSALRRSGAPAALPPPAKRSLPVLFTRSAKEARWESGTLLELAESRGLMPEYSCRRGSCGTCKTKILAGKVTYLEAPTAPHAEDEALICCALPAEQDGSVQLDL